MAERTELDDLRERLAKLSADELLHVIELAIGDARHRRTTERAAIQAENLAAEAVLRRAERERDDEAVRADLAALEDWYRQRGLLGAGEGAMREAG